MLAASMAGHKTGVATQINALNGKCLFIHCYRHALNLAVGDSIKAVSCLNETFEVVREICKLVKKSPQKGTHLSKLRAETSDEKIGVRTFCLTRWTVSGEHGRRIPGGCTPPPPTFSSKCNVKHKTAVFSIPYPLCNVSLTNRAPPPPPPPKILLCRLW